MPNFWNRVWRVLRISLVFLAGMILIQRSVLEPGDQVERVRAFTRQIEFDYTAWTLDALRVKLGQTGLGSTAYLSPEIQHQTVIDYLSLVDQIFRYEGYVNDYYTNPDITDPETASQELRQELNALYKQRADLAPLAEAVFQDQLSSIAAQLGLTIWGQPLPPVLFHSTPLPLALIVSPRKIIRQDANISLVPNFTVDQRATLEDQVDQAMDVSSIVVNIGGVGMYPTMVAQTTNINWLAEVIAHEWAHNVLTLRPLGANYNSSLELRVINETTAGIVGTEIGEALIERFYPEFVPQPPPEVSETEQSSEPATPPDPPAFDYRAEMHETRLTADQLLAEGEIEEAEVYMENRRQIFVENGYRIRKLNQAFFAFHGAYADRPGGAAGASEDPVGSAVRTLRTQSPSLAVFLNRISWMWSYEQLTAAVDKN
jgi:hypothetical protein